MQYFDIRKTDKIVSEDEGSVVELYDEYGEMIIAFPVKKGVSSARELHELAYSAASYKTVGCIVVRARSIWGVQPHPEKHESGADPDWRPDHASVAERQMRRMIADMSAKQTRMAREMRQIAEGRKKQEQKEEQKQEQKEEQKQEQKVEQKQEQDDDQDQKKAVKPERKSDDEQSRHQDQAET